MKNDMGNETGFIWRGKSAIFQYEVTEYIPKA